MGSWSHTTSAMKWLRYLLNAMDTSSKAMAKLLPMRIKRKAKTNRQMVVLPVAAAIPKKYLPPEAGQRADLTRNPLTRRVFLLPS